MTTDTLGPQGQDFYPKRRSFMGHLAGGISAAVLIKGCVNTSAPDPDALLRQAAAEFHRLNNEYLGLRPVILGFDDAAGDAAWNHCNATIWDRQDELIDQLTAMRAVTPDGVKDKAGILEVWLRQKVPDGVNRSFEEAAEPHELLAMSLARDVLAREVRA